MVKYGDSGRAFRRQRGRHRQKRQPIDAVSVFFFFLRPPPLLLCLFLGMKRKLRTSCQPIALALGHSVLGDRKKSLENLWRSSIFPKMIMNTSARRGSLEGLLLCRHLCDEMVVDEEPSKPARLVRSGCRGRTGKTQSLPKKVVWAAKKWIFDRRGKLSLGCCAIGHERKENKPKIKNKKNKKNEAEKRGRSSIRRARGSPIKKLTVSFTVSRACIVKHDRIYGIFSWLGPKIP